MNKVNVLVTGSAGFVGNRLIEEILSSSSPLEVETVKALDLRFNERLDDPRVTQIKGNIEDYNAIESYFEGCDVVFHMAAVVDWGTYSDEDVYRTNVEATENIVRACRLHGVKVLIFTSSLDAIFGGKPVRDADESVPYPDAFPNIYCRSKADAERTVMAANGTAHHTGARSANGTGTGGTTLKTVCIRPADIYGEGDPFHIDALLAMAKKNMYVRIGDGTAKSRHVYVGNVAHAHLLAASAVLSGNEKPCGNVYFITDGEPSNFFSFFDDILIRAGYELKPKNVWLPAWLMYVLGTVNELFAFLIRPIHKYNPNVSRFAVTYTCTDFTFSSKRAERDFGFTPHYSEEEALQNTANYYRAVAAEDELPRYTEG